ncbi:conjugal transfer protein, partial [Rhodococcus hoagii]|nr:conjugal transfer protein [Prescottella equi]
MSNRTVRDPSEHDVTLELIGVCAAVAVIGVGGASAAMHLGTSQDVPGNPVAVIVGLIKGELVWETGATVVAVALGLVLITLVG